MDGRKRPAFVWPEGFFRPDGFVKWDREEKENNVG
jgi:hypothetical protein